MVKRVLSAFAALVSCQPMSGVETLLVFDEAHGQYIWLQAGCMEDRRIYGVTVYACIVDGKIQIEQDWSEDGLADEPLQAPGLREDLVLVYHEPAACTRLYVLVSAWPLPLKQPRRGLRQLDGLHLLLCKDSHCNYVRDKPADSARPPLHPPV